MRHLSRISVTVCALLLLTGAARTDSRRQIVLIRSSDVTLHAEPDSLIGQYYTVSYALPDSLTSADLGQAILELFVDVRAKPRDGFLNEAPMLEVYALNQPPTGRFNPESLSPEGRALRAVAVGSGRRVVLDVTRLVRSHLDGAIENNGLIIGSLTGMREGVFTFVSGRLPEGAVGQLRVYRRHEFVPLHVPSEAGRSPGP